MSPFRKRRRHHVRGKSFPGDADSASSLRCNTITSRHASAAFSSNVLYTAGISCPPARTSSTVSCASVLKRSTFQQARVFAGNTLPSGLQTDIHTMPGQRVSQVVDFPAGRPERPVCVINTLCHVVKLCALLPPAGETESVPGNCGDCRLH